MSVTEKLLRVFRVDAQLRGLQSRLQGAERFLEEQQRQIAEIDTKAAALEAQHRLIRATIANHEGEIKRLDARIEALRQQMDLARTNKEYKAFLTEMNTYKADRGKVEEEALGHMAKSDEFKKQLDDFAAKRAERETIRQVAAQQRDQRTAEIKDRLAELRAERVTLSSQVPAETLRTYEQLLLIRGEETMAPIEEQDRRRHEFTCGACMMNLPVESINALLTTGVLTKCVSCGSILFIESDLVQAMQPTASRK